MGKGKDRKQDKRIKSLEKLVYKTLENKQIDFESSSNISSSGLSVGGFISLNQGTGDGDDYGDSARIGNSITMMSQRVDMNIIGETGTFNQVRVLIVESMDGNQALALSDVLKYSSFALHGDLVFVSPYTTKTTTNRRYKVHTDKLLELHGTGDAGKATAQIRKLIKFGKSGKLVAFNGTATGPTNHRVSIMLISDSAVAGHPSLKYNVRTVYKDA